MKKFLENFLEMQDYPRDAAISLISDYEKLMADPDEKALFDKYLSEYESNDKTNFGEFVTLVGRESEKCGVHRFSAELIVFLCSAKHLREIYIKRGLPTEIWHDSMLDMRYKLMECKKMHNIWGSFVASWFCGFFTLERFQIGRLQYELSWHFATEGDLETCGLKLEYHKTDLLNLHIPSSGPLTDKAVYDSLHRAYKFFAKYLPKFLVDGKLVVECSSWLLFSDHEKFLPESSNILAFMRHFNIVHSWYEDNFGDCWRIFNVNWNGDVSALPRETSLQRAYADWLGSGNRAGGGNGIIVYDGEKIINK